MTTKQPVISANNYLIDTHCHLDMGNYGDELPDILRRAERGKVKKIITIGIDLPSSKAAIELAKQYESVFATIGIHPHDVSNIDYKTYDELRQLFTANTESIVGYGEIGLDYAKMYSPVDIQMEHFHNQLMLASDFKLPVIIHCRDAQDDLLTVLKQHAPFKNGGVIHCFSGSIVFAKAVLELGFHISIPGIASFKNAKELHEVVRTIPLDNMLIETDGPFLAPTPFRGKRNEPAYLLYTAEHIARLRETSIDEIAEKTSHNAEKLFNI